MIWTTVNSSLGSSSRVAGDWTCPQCGDLVFAFKNAQLSLDRSSKPFGSFRKIGDFMAIFWWFNDDFMVILL